MKKILVLLVLIIITISVHTDDSYAGSDPLLGEIILFAGNFAPRGWAFCHGQLLQISQNAALFSILGTTYGGDGRTTFALPDLRGRVPLGAGNGPGLTNRPLGYSGGSETHTLTTAQIPAHNHALTGTSEIADTTSPDGARISDKVRTKSYNSDSSASPDLTLHQQSIANTGGTQPHNNVQPYLGVNYIIALTGVFPSPN